tara:strand:+ start:452 stop:844 length:393 start_codon:yes stop_codon:yes gene_type:complete
MEIKDKNGKLLALVIRFNDIVDEKYFATDDNEDFQVASFNLEKESIIEKHIHNEQDRNIKTTSEVLVVLDGKIEVDIYDDNLDFVESLSIFSSDTIALFNGGHGIRIKENTKFIEVKQGPYDSKTDKKRF